MNVIEILVAILFIIISLIVTFIFIAETTSYDLAIGVFIICAILGIIGIIDGLRRE